METLMVSTVVVGFGFRNTGEELGKPIIATQSPSLDYGIVKLGKRMRRWGTDREVM